MMPISVHVSDDDYQELKSLASRRGRPVAELIREAIGEYLVRKRRTGRSVLDLPAHPSGKLLAEWRSSDLYDEMLKR